MEQIISAIIGAVAALITVVISSWRAQRQHNQLQEKAQIRHEQSHENKADELFMTALTFLEGGSQRRNVGIAAISLYLQEDSRHLQLCRELLIGAAIYLINESKQKGKLHETYNLKRIMKLIIENIPDDDKQLVAYKELKESLKNWHSKAGDDRGLHLEKELVDTWKQKLNIKDDNKLFSPRHGMM